MYVPSYITLRLILNEGVLIFRKYNWLGETILEVIILKRPKLVDKEIAKMMFVLYHVITVVLTIIYVKLTFSQPIWTVSGHLFCQNINQNRAWRVIRGWKNRPVRNKFYYSIIY